MASAEPARLLELEELLVLLEILLDKLLLERLLTEELLNEKLLLDKLLLDELLTEELFDEKLLLDEVVDVISEELARLLALEELLVLLEILLSKLLLEGLLTEELLNEKLLFDEVLGVIDGGLLELLPPPPPQAVNKASILLSNIMCFNINFPIVHKSFILDIIGTVIFDQLINVCGDCARILAKLRRKRIRNPCLSLDQKILPLSPSF